MMRRRMQASFRYLFLLHLMLLLFGSCSVETFSLRSSTSQSLNLLLSSSRRRKRTTTATGRRRRRGLSLLSVTSTTTNSNSNSKNNFRESSQVYKIRHCTTLKQIKKALKKSVLKIKGQPTRTSSNIDDNDEYFLTSLSQYLTPNLSSAALLRTSQLLSRSLRRRRRRRRRTTEQQQQQEAGEDDDRDENYLIIISSLLNRMEYFLTRAIPPPRRSLVDTLSALAILKQRKKLLNHGRGGDIIISININDNKSYNNNTTKKQQDHDDDDENDGRIRRLTNILVERLDNDKEPLLRLLPPFRMVDVLNALQILALGGDDDDRSIESKGGGEEKDGISSSKNNTNNIQGHAITTTATTEAAARRIQVEICKKLTGGHALSALSAGDMSIGLTTLAAANNFPFVVVANNNQQESSSSSSSSKLAVAFMRRLRKQGVRQSATTKQLLLAIRAVTDIGMQVKEMLLDEESPGATTTDNNYYQRKLFIFKEAQKMVFTVFEEILDRHQNSYSTTEEEREIIINNNSSSNRKSRPVVATAKKDTIDLKLHQISDLLQSLVTMEALKKKQSATNTALQSLWQTFLSTTGQQALQHASVDEMARFLRAVEGTQSTELALPSSFVRTLGEHFHEKVMANLAHQEEDCNKETLSIVINPKSVNTVLRFVAVRWGHDDVVMEQFRACSQELFMNYGFLEECTAAELTHFLTFMQKTQYHVCSHPSTQSNNGGTSSLREDPLFAITGRVLDPDISETISPAQASRILSSFAAVVTEKGRHNIVAAGANNEMYINTTRNLFHTVGGHLLTDRPDDLCPRDISDALCAYAKSNYFQDMGIFDHLTSLLAARVDDCSVRQIARSLWACGKMTAWEVQDNEDSSLAPPPYVKDANFFAAFLSQHKDEMTAKDVAQSLWALAKLQSVQNPQHEAPAEFLNVFVWRATKLAPQMTSQEVANILWSMSKLGYRECDGIVQSFTERILHLHSTPGEKSTPQDAANIMIALGRMEIRDEDVFNVLSNDMLNQLDVASAQAIANALWAHKSVHITPPQQLLDRWATERLGLVAVQPRRQQ